MFILFSLPPDLLSSLHRRIAHTVRYRLSPVCLRHGRIPGPDWRNHRRVEGLPRAALVWMGVLHHRDGRAVHRGRRHPHFAGSRYPGTAGPRRWHSVLVDILPRPRAPPSVPECPRPRSVCVLPVFRWCTYSRIDPPH